MKSVVIPGFVALILLFSAQTGSLEPVEPLWVDTLPSSIQKSILWIGDLEEGTLDDWSYSGFLYPGGGVFNSGEPDIDILVSPEITHSGTFAAKTTITSAFQAENESRAVRLMRWTDRPWDDNGEFFPNAAYYSAWLYVPHTYNPNKYEPWDPGDGGWWIVFQFKSVAVDGEDSEPVWTLHIDHDDDEGFMFFRLFSLYNPPLSHLQTNPVPIPVGEWVHLEAFYEQSVTQDGRITVWQNGQRILHVPNVRTILLEPARWGIGNYTDHIDGGPTPGSATLYFDDAVVSTKRVSRVVTPGALDASK